MTIKKSPFATLLTRVRSLCAIIHVTWNSQGLGAVGIAQLQCLTKIVRKVKLKDVEAEEYDALVDELSIKYGSVEIASIAIQDLATAPYEDSEKRGTVSEAVLWTFGDLCRHYAKLSLLEMASSGIAGFELILKFLEELPLSEEAIPTFQKVLNELKVTSSGNGVLDYIRAVEKILVEHGKGIDSPKEITTAEIEQIVTRLTARQLNVAEDKVDHETMIPDAMGLVTAYMVEVESGGLVLGYERIGWTVGAAIFELALAEAI